MILIHPTREKIEHVRIRLVVTTRLSNHAEAPMAAKPVSMPLTATSCGTGVMLNKRLPRYAPATRCSTGSLPLSLKSWRR